MKKKKIIHLHMILCGRRGGGMVGGGGVNADIKRHIRWQDGVNTFRNYSMFLGT